MAKQMKDKQRDVINYLYNCAMEEGDFRAALDLANTHKAPRKLRKAAKLIKKILRGWIRIGEGKPVQPIAEKHFRR